MAKRIKKHKCKYVERAEGLLKRSRHQLILKRNKVVSSVMITHKSGASRRCWPFKKFNRFRRGITSKEYLAQYVKREVLESGKFSYPGEDSYRISLERDEVACFIDPTRTPTRQESALTRVRKNV